MEETKSTLALILYRQDYREHDSLVTVYAPSEGRLQLLARGTKKLHSKLAGFIEPLTLADIMIIPGRGRSYLGSALTRCAYLAIRADLNKLYYAGQAVKLYLRQTEENPGDEELFRLLVDWLDLLDSFSSDDEEFSRDRGELWLVVLVWRFLAATGRRPQMQACVNCRQVVLPGKNYFDRLGGGLVCNACFNSSYRDKQLVSPLLTISDNCCKIIRFILDSSHDLRTIAKLRVDKPMSQELSSLTFKFLDFVKSE